MPKNDILHRCYSKLVLLQAKGQINWSSYIQNILYSLGDRYKILWDSQSLDNDERAITHSKELIYLQHMENIMSDVSMQDDSKKLRLYKTFKKEFKMESYLLCVDNVKHRYSLSRFRMSSHNLGIETGRHCKKPVSQRTCLYCTNPSIDDEIHFLLH